MTKPQSGSFNGGMGDKKNMDAFVARMAAGRAAAKSRASSEAPPSKPASIRRPKGAAPNPPSSPNTNTTVGSETRIPVPASGGMNVTITINGKR